MKEQIVAQLEESASVKNRMAVQLSDVIMNAVTLTIDTLENGGKILFCGNGGSAADSQHLTAEFVCRLKRERRAIPAISLTTDTSILTAVANDCDFSQIFMRQVEAYGRKDDLLFGISTSGNSANVVKAVEYAKSVGMRTIALTGEDGGKLAELVDIAICVPSKNTQRIQEAHITIGHILCDLVEQSICGNR